MTAMDDTIDRRLTYEFVRLGRELRSPRYPARRSPLGFAVPLAVLRAFEHEPPNHR